VSRTGHRDGGVPDVLVSRPDPPFVTVRDRMVAGSCHTGAPGCGTRGGPHTVRVDHPPSPGPAGWLAVLLAGGTSRRWGGTDKTARLLGGTAVLVHAVSGLPAQVRALAVVAPPDHPARGDVEAALGDGVPVRWVVEDPPRSGPLAGLAAGLEALATLGPAARTVTPGPAARRRVAVLAGDLPFTRPAWARLAAALDADRTVDGAVGLGEDGRRQPLLALYREGPLRARLAAVDVRDAPMRLLTGALHLAEVPLPAAQTLDVDTPQDAERAERLLAEGFPG